MIMGKDVKKEEYKNNLPMFLIGVAIAIISFVLISVCKPYLNMPNGTFYDYLYYGLLGEDVIGNAERIAHAVASGSISMNNVLFYALVIVDALLIVVNLVSGFIRLFEKDLFTFFAILTLLMIIVGVKVFSDFVIAIIIVVIIFAVFSLFT